MKLPFSPPSWREFVSQTPPPRIAELYAHPELRSYWRDNDRYLHWDEFRHRPMPEGFSAEECWLIVKAIRHATYREVPLKDKQGAPFVFGMPSQLTELLQQIDRGIGFANALDGASSPPAARDSYVLNTLIEESITSSQLEGAATTRVIAKEMLRANRPPRDLGERMILNNYLTMQRIRELKDQPLSLERLLELHRKITQDTLDKPEAAGRLRRSDEQIRAGDFSGEVEYHVPPPAEELPERLRALCDFANVPADQNSGADFIHPVLRGIILHFALAYIHPFYDGNGRTARTLFYWFMLRADYPLFEIISISHALLRAPIRYARAFLYTETDDNDLTYFILHQAEVIREAAKALHAYHRRKQRELRAVSGYLNKVPGLNHRQQALLAHALREPGSVYQITAHARSHGVTHQTARDDLFALVERGLLAVSKMGRSYAFRAEATLGEKLSKTN